MSVHQVQGDGPNSDAGDGKALPSPVVVIERRPLISHCLAQTLRAAGVRYRILTFKCCRDWLDTPSDESPPKLIVLSVPHEEDGTFATELSQVLYAAGDISVIVLAENEEPERILATMESGVRGYIPTSSTFEVTREAINLVLAGGMYIPANSLLMMRGGLDRSVKPAEEVSSSADGFTAKQIAVLRALREGKANKIIAYELSMCESTVKVHIRNIMKKVHAHNRTEVAFKTSQIFSLGKHNHAANGKMPLAPN